MQPMFRAHRDSDGFTLSELLVVLAVILLLISVGPIIVFLTRTFEAPE